MATNIKIVSNTLVKNGMPFIQPVIEQALPYVNRAIITISEKSDDGTREVLERMARHNDKIELMYENVSNPGELTQERQKQLNRTFEDWVWFLDDDDWWSRESIEEVVELLNKEEDVDAYSFTPYQLINKSMYDMSWLNKSFTKFFKYQDKVNYRHPWPKDLIYKGDEVLYWRTNPRVLRVPIRFIHLSKIKKSSFRTESWAKNYLLGEGKPAPIPEELKPETERIYSCLMK